jgi:glycosyltransferase involved in cell wall biosynthesis
MNISGSESNYLFFSLVIPAHNEQGYIDKAIQSIIQVDYPKEKLEAIIIENGSEDKTDEIINELSPDWFQVLASREPGVSKAKNKGIEQLSGHSDWVVFLDADTWFEKGFLKELNDFLLANRDKNLGCGMLSLLPYPDSRQARSWFNFYNFANHVTHTTRSIQIIRRDLLREIRFDEALTFDEDTFLLRQCIARSKYFFLKTNKVFASTRRFDKKGWIGQLIEWVSYATSSYEKKKTLNYKVVR